MAKKVNGKLPKKMWRDITENDFIDADDIVDEDIGEFNIAAMQIYAANENYARQLVNIMDSLTLVRRRILYSFYKLGATPGKKTKCSNLVSSAMKYHNHGDGSVYQTIINMIQGWKVAVPYISGPSNFGQANIPNKYGAYRYTEAYLSQYSYECFFSDFSMKAIGTATFVTGLEEPRFLPSKFPNILVNGTSGVGYGHSAMIPPYHIDDIIELCKTYMKDPDAEDIIVYPDFPTGCYVVENDDMINQICKTGLGAITMRAQIEIEEMPNDWKLSITNIPYTVSFEKVYKDQILPLCKKGVIKVKHVGDYSEIYENDDGTTFTDPRLEIRLDKSLDPKRVRADLYRLTDLEKTISIQFKAVVGETDIKVFGLKGLVLEWLSQRRLYKSSLYNHTLNRLRSEIDIRDILIELTESDNLQRTIDIIRRTVIDRLPEALMKEYGMSSHQAKVISGMKLGAFTADAHDRYVNERKDLMKQFEETRDIAYSPKKIDKIILKELEDLRKYGPVERRSPIIQVSNEEIISNTDHVIIFTSQNYVKKLPKEPDKYHVKNPAGTIAPGDRVTSRATANNLDNIILFDDFGRYTTMPVHEIPNTVYSSFGETLYNVAKLEGNLIGRMVVSDPKASNTTVESDKRRTLDFDAVYVVTLTAQGFLKATPYSDFTYTSDDKGNQKIAVKYNARAMKLKDNDKACAMNFICYDDKAAEETARDARLIVYTKGGQYVLIPTSEMPIQAKDTMGLKFITPTDGDECTGVEQVYPTESLDPYVVVLTAKGYVKKIESKYLYESKKRNDASYLTKLDDGDEVIFVNGCNENESLVVITKTNGEMWYPIEQIPTLSRSAKGKKLIPVPNGDCISNACIDIPYPDGTPEL